MNFSSARPSVDRRRFLQIIGLGVSSALTVPAVSFAQSASGPPKATTPATPAPATPPAATPPANTPSEISEDARALAEIVRRRYGKHLTPDQLEAVTRELDQRVQAGRRLKDAKLANRDEPDFTFKP